MKLAVRQDAIGAADGLPGVRLAAGAVRRRPALRSAVYFLSSQLPLTLSAQLL
jgi:hypothetical protein